MKKRIIFLSLILIILVIGCVPEEKPKEKVEEKIPEEVPLEEKILSLEEKVEECKKELPLCFQYITATERYGEALRQGKDAQAAYDEARKLTERIRREKIDCGPCSKAYDELKKAKIEAAKQILKPIFYLKSQFTLEKYLDKNLELMDFKAANGKMYMIIKGPTNAFKRDGKAYTPSTLYMLDQSFNLIKKLDKSPFHSRVRPIQDGTFWTLSGEIGEYVSMNRMHMWRYNLYHFDADGKLLSTTPYCTPRQITEWECPRGKGNFIHVGFGGDWTVDTSGHLLIVDNLMSMKYFILKYTTDGKYLSHIGRGKSKKFTQEEKKELPFFSGAANLVTDGQDNIYLTEGNKIWSLNPDGTIRFAIELKYAVRNGFDVDGKNIYANQNGGVVILNMPAADGKTYQMNTLVKGIIGETEDYRTSERFKLNVKFVSLDKKRGLLYIVDYSKRPYAIKVFSKK